MKRHLLIAALAATMAIPAAAAAAPAAAQSMTVMVSAVSAPQSYDRYDRRGGRDYDRGYRGQISRDEAARIGSRYLDQVTQVTQRRDNGVSFVSGRQRDGSLVLVTVHADGRIASVVTTFDRNGRRVNRDHGIGDSGYNRW